MPLVLSDRLEDQPVTERMDDEFANFQSVIDEIDYPILIPQSMSSDNPAELDWSQPYRGHESRATASLGKLFGTSMCAEGWLILVDDPSFPRPVEPEWPLGETTYVAKGVDENGFNQQDLEPGYAPQDLATNHFYSTNMPQPNAFGAQGAFYTPQDLAMNQFHYTNIPQPNAFGAQDAFYEPQFEQGMSQYCPRL